MPYNHDYVPFACSPPVPRSGASPYPPPTVITFALASYFESDYFSHFLYGRSECRQPTNSLEATLERIQVGQATHLKCRGFAHRVQVFRRAFPCISMAAVERKLARCTTASPETLRTAPFTSCIYLHCVALWFRVALSMIATTAAFKSWGSAGQARTTRANSGDSRSSSVSKSVSLGSPSS